MTGQRTDDFDYDLPPALVAQQPSLDRDAGRLLLLDRATGVVSHATIRQLPSLLAPGTLLVVNDSRVLPARLAARRPTGGRVELLLLERLAAEPRDGVDGERWLAMVRASKRPGPGELLVVGGGEQPGETLRVEVAGPVAGGRAELWLPGDGVRLADQHGSVPLPPYIRRAANSADRDRYQTVYANVPGSVAAPTAGLHLSRRLLAEIEAAGVEVASLTLHVGPGTFVPVRVDRIDEHEMEAERFELGEATADRVRRARSAGRRVVAVGTTAVRALEGSQGRPGAGRTALFIVPGYRFEIVDGLLTNFHLPRSTLLMLVSALAGRERVLAAYREAVALGYRFYSYGDAMLIL